ncbi:hypothetical protein IKX73_02810 [Candidatus Saccharibacteria bacterium]|nr:hypothetical protein [Candidatus Saccharibacteria bacterium]
MNQNDAVDNDLQKAIDDITKTTNQDPVFADPVAAPSSVPEGDNGELAESVGPFPAPKPIPRPPRPPRPPMRPASSSFTLPTPPAPAVPDLTPIAPEPPMPVAEETTVVAETEFQGGHNMREVKAAALRDLAPLVGKMNLPASQKFSIYRDMFENLHDHTVIEPAYQAAKNIQDETERGEALLYLIESIDNM